MQTLESGRLQSPSTPERQPTDGNTQELHETSRLLEAKGISEPIVSKPEEQAPVSLQKLAVKTMHERRQQILKKGSIPEFVPVKNINEFYKVY